MKKYNPLKLLFIFILFSSFTYALPLFEDDFNRADSNTIANGWGQDQDAVGDVQILNNEVLLYGTTGTRSSIYRTLLINTNRLEFQVKVEDTTPESDIRIYTNSGTDLTIYLLIYNDNLAFFDGSINNVMSFSDNTYYNVQIYNIDYGLGTYDIYVDDVFKTSANFNTYSTGVIDDITFTPIFTSGEIFYIDDFKSCDNNLCITPSIFNINLNYPLNQTIFTSGYNGSYIIDLNNVNGTANCDINDTKWSFDSNNNITYNFLNNTDINTNNNSIFVNCTDSEGVKSNLSSWFYLDSRLLLNFYDELTQNIINQSINIEIISEDETFSHNYTTANGSLEVIGLDTNNYVLILSSNGYDIRTFDANIKANQLTNLTLYLLNESLGTNIICNVFDSTGSGLEGYNVRVQKLINGNYQEVEVSKTNFEGKTVILAQTFTPFYKFIIEKDGVIYKSTSETEITATTLNFFITIGEDIIIPYTKSSDILYNLTYNDNLTRFEFDYVDPSNSLSSICMRVYKKTNYSSEVLYNEKCLTTSSGQILTTIVEESGSIYTAKVFVSFSPEQYLDIIIKSFYNTLDLIQNEQKIGIWLTVVLIIVFAFIGIWFPAVSLFLINFVLWITSILGFHELSKVVLTGVTVMSIVLGYLISKK